MSEFETVDELAEISPQGIGKYGQEPPCIVSQSDEEYHDPANPAVSRSFLWTGYSRSWAHAKFGKAKETKSMDFGHLAHTAILQPDMLESLYIACDGDPAKNTKVWKEFAEEAALLGLTPLKASEWKDAIGVRESVMRTPEVRRMLGDNPIIEQAGYAVDPTTGLLTRCKPDAYNERLAIIGDIKTAADARVSKWQWSVLRYGYHFQEAHYRVVWEEVGMPVNGFVFFVVEPDPPYAISVVELAPEWVEEGYAIRAKALAAYAECKKTNTWPAYAPGVQLLELPPSGFVETKDTDFVETED